MKKVKSRLFYFIVLFLFFSEKSQLNALVPSDYINDNIFLYAELEPLNISIPKLHKIFTRLMNKKKADNEWKAFEEMFQEDFGMNLLSTESIESNGFSTTSPIGFSLRYIPVKNKKSLTYNRLLTIIIGYDGSEKPFDYFLNLYPATPSETAQTSPVKILEKNKLLYLNNRKNPTFVLKTKDAIIISEDYSFIKSINSHENHSLKQNAYFQNFKKSLQQHKFSKDQIACFFINSEKSDIPIRENPRLILDNVLMDNNVIHELSKNSEYIGGVFRILSNNLQVTMDYYFPDKFLDNQKVYLGKFLDFKSKKYFPDNALSDPFSYIKWQSNFEKTIKQTSEGSLFNRSNISKFLGNLFDTRSLEIPKDLEYLLKDNISLYVQEVPSFKYFNKIYLWKGYLSIHYNPEYLQVFEKFMLNMNSRNSEYPKNYTIGYKESSGVKTWEIALKKMSKKYDRKKDEVITEEKIYNFYIRAENQQLILSHDPDLQKRIPAAGLIPIFSRVDPGNSGQNQIIFAYLDIKKFLKYIDTSSFALPLKNYFSYFEKGKSLLFKIYRNSNILSEEIFLTIDR